ncbi:hypothetical protein R1flu_028207 [Riccia fluitans]|uniref:Uncharacterized protein n=1 Tax=Riccia fluitans TaxID=41844 RepID=A0ABD1XL17_9MARC
MSLELGLGEPNEWQAKSYPCVHPRLVATTLHSRTRHTLEYYEGIGHSDLVTHGRNSPLFDGSEDALTDELRDKDCLQVDLSERKGWMQLTRMRGQEMASQNSPPMHGVGWQLLRTGCGKDCTVGNSMPFPQGWFSLNTVQIASVLISGMEVG